MLNHQFDEVAHILRVNAGSSAFKFGSDKASILQCLLDEADVAKPELEVEIKWNEGAFVQESRSDRLIFVHLEFDVA